MAKLRRLDAQHFRPPGASGEDPQGNRRRLAGAYPGAVCEAAEAIMRVSCIDEAWCLRYEHESDRRKTGRNSVTEAVEETVRERLKTIERDKQTAAPWDEVKRRILSRHPQP